MKVEELKLDGNGAAGALQAVFGLEVTSARATCAFCGAVGPLGTLDAYVDAPGIVIRCTACTQVVLRVVAAGDRYWLDASGARCLELRSAAG